MTSPFAKHWTLDPSVTFLNHGSFGACPRVVLDEQQRLRAQLEAEPLHFFIREHESLLDAARSELARFVGAKPEEIAFVPNATTGVNTVLRSLTWKPGDELLTTDHEYNACRNALDFVAEQAGARVVVACVPFPLFSEDEVVDAVLAKVTSRTRLALLDHITSPTGLILPVERLIRELSAKGVETLIDGAHAPGMVPLDLTALGATYYTGNCHKWLCAPKGAAFLRVPRDRQPMIRPLTISHGANSVRTDRSRFHMEFDWTGTHDPTPYLCVPHAIRFMDSVVPGGWSEVMKRNRVLALEARKILCAAHSIAAPAPDSMIGSMASVPLPDSSVAGDLHAAIDSLQEVLFNDNKIEVPVFSWPKPPARILRVSAQLYNEPSQYAKLSALI